MFSHNNGKNKGYFLGKLSLRKIDTHQQGFNLVFLKYSFWFYYFKSDFFFNYIKFSKIYKENKRFLFLFLPYLSN